MKKTDIAMLILVVAVCAGIAYAVVGAIPALKAPDEAVQVDTIEAYRSDVSNPDKDIFNSSAINPTVDITIGDASEAVQR